MRAALMGYLTAISHHHLAHDAEASRLVARSDGLLDGFLQAGDLTEQWQVPALCLLASVRARQAALAEAKEPVDSKWLESRRAAWKPIKDLLEQASERARRQDYAEAARVYRSLLSDPRFQDSLLAFSDSDLRKMALTFVLTDATEDYLRVCERAFGEVSFYGWHVDPWPLCFLVEALPEGMSKQLESWASIRTQEAIRKAAESEKPPYDHLLDIGLVCSQLGRYADASLALNAAKQGLANPSRSLLARALHAKCKLHLGDTESSDRELSKVQEEFTRTLELGEGRMDPEWTAQAMASAVLLEARESTRQPNKERSRSTFQH